MIFEKNEVVKDDGKPYTIFTPYSKKWKAKLNDFYLKKLSNKKYFTNFHQQAAKQIPSLKAIGFEKTGSTIPNRFAGYDHYKTLRQTTRYPGHSRHQSFGCTPAFWYHQHQAAGAKSDEVE